MRSIGHPCHKTPDYWRAARREYRRLHIVMTWLGWLGLLNEALFPTRWLHDQLRVLERGLRGLLVLGAPRQTPTDATISAPPGSSSASSNPMRDASLASGPDVSRMDANDAFRIRRARFSLSLKDYGPPNAPSGPVGQTGLVTRVVGEASDAPQSSSAHKASDLIARLDAVGHALANAESYVACMAQRLASCGLRVRRRVLRPANWAGFTLDPGWSHRLDAEPPPVPVLDSS